MNDILLIHKIRLGYILLDQLQLARHLVCVELPDL